MSDSPEVLNRECHADVRLMYRQRFFTENSAKLLQGFSSATPGTGLELGVAVVGCSSIGV